MINKINNLPSLINKCIFQCGLGHLPKCEHDYVIAQNVNRILMIEFNCETIFQILN
jgi:hypothetical protein